jgi:hypothetical protein
VRGQEYDTAAAVELALDQFPVFHADVAGDAVLWRAPHERQLDDRFARLGDGGAQMRTVAGEFKIAAQAAPIGRGGQVNQPAERRAERM